ncbi:uncharacterized protein LAESUDRAFT_729351 [Laetiporus sulphureus 93-53]|uniref:PIH1 N-terminal domain-containing protein n=1 Tax=Laetiporus sulphureus 93-53 TaxID=1314785 RepID=A0A165CRV3_9APHY|nr:uncharacterized protein LAESUDRAFT_729351 [Laetiporus sulphureus 93-53]KZT03324.1 hypothetical protein LAESUDRAFT_729351 [Laetiporus sulphureus 93-53]
MNTIKVSLSPSPGFCVKSIALKAAVCKLTPPLREPSSKLDGPSAVSATISIPKGVKIFVNIAWDRNVPPPPEGSEDAIQRAMTGEDEPGEHNEKGWFVPLVVSDPREDRDKAGKLSVVFDCLFHSSLKSRALKDPEFKTFLIELAFQRIEAQYAFALSRQVGTPNIKFKGELHPRIALIPAVLFPEGHPARSTTPPRTQSRPKLIEELDATVVKSTDEHLAGPSASSPVSTEARAIPELSWAKEADTVKIVLQVPDLTRSHVPAATLDLEPRRLMLDAPPLYALDLNLDLSDAQISDAAKLSDASAAQALTLKRQRDLDVDNARAEWRVGEGRLVIYA